MKNAKRVLLFIAAILLVCGMAVTASAASKGKISSRKATICVKQTMTLKVTGTKGKVKWSSSNKKIAKVNSKGKVTGVKAGTATIKAKVNKKTFSCKVKVKSSGLSKTKVTLEVGKTTKIKLYGTKIKSVKSSKTSVATISKKGKITAKNVGSCTLTIKGKNGRKYKCKVNVTAKNDQGSQEGQTPQTPQTEKPQDVKLTGLTLSQTSADMVVGQTVVLTATPAPANASNKTVTWTSSNAGVASVDGTGTVKALAVGSAQITATAEDGSGVKAVCTVNVLSQVATSQDQLAQLAKAAAAGAPTVTLQSDAKAVFTIPAGTYTNTELIVNVPNGEVVNPAKFRQVTVQAISSNTYVEQAGNLVVFKAPAGRIRVEGQTAASIQVDTAAGAALTVENNGALSQVTLNVPSQLTITGSKYTRIPVTAAAGAANSVITTDKNLRLTANAKVSLVLNAGAEHTNAYITNENNIPSVSGLGSVTVTNTATHDVEAVVAEYNGSVAGADRKVSIRGRIIDWQNEAALEGAALYLLRYSRVTDTDNISQYLNSALSRATSDSEGMYSLANVALGNYYLVACKDGMETSVQTLTVTSTAGDIFNNGTIQLAPEGSGTGSIVGTVYDAYTGEPVDYTVSLKLRKGQNNLSGAALKSTVSDAEGNFRFDDLRTGTYTIQALTAAGSAETIAATSDYVTVTPDGVSRRDITVTRSLDLGEMRFVLRWNDEDSGAPRDLDSHLVGPAPGGGRFHTWFDDREYYYDELYDGLDHDDTTWEGPETSTIYHMVPGSYDFYVYDYTNQEDESSSEMSEKSDAYVQVYFGDSADAYETFYIPKGQSGNLWHVCSYDSGTGILSTVNKVGYWPDDEGAGIGGSVLDVLRSRLDAEIGRLEEVCDELPEGSYRTALQKALEEAKALYAGSSDEAALTDMVSKLSSLRSEAYDVQNLLDDISTLQELCDGLAEGAYKTEVQAVLARANALAAGTPDEDAIEEMSDELWSYIDTIRSMKELPDMVASLEALFEDRQIAMSEEEKAEIKQVIEDASAKISSGTMTPEEMRELSSTLEGYIDQLESLPDAAQRSAFDSAQAIALDTGYAASVGEDNYYVYYSYTPESNGTYLLSVSAQPVGAEPWIELYKGYTELTSGYDSLGEELQAGVRYVFRISEGWEESASYTITLTKTADAADELKAELRDSIDELKSYYSAMPDECQYKAELTAALADAEAMYEGEPTEAELQAMLDRLSECYDGAIAVRSLINNIDLLGSISKKLADDNADKAEIQTLLEEAAELSTASTDASAIWEKSDQLEAYIEKYQPILNLSSMIVYTQDLYDSCKTKGILDETSAAEMEATFAEVREKLNGTLTLEEADTLIERMETYDNELEALLLKYDIDHNSVPIALDTPVAGRISKETPFLYYTFTPGVGGRYTLTVDANEDIYPEVTLYEGCDQILERIDTNALAVDLEAETSYTFKVALLSMSDDQSCTVTLTKTEDSDDPADLTDLAALDDLSTIVPDDVLEIDLTTVGEDAAVSNETVDAVAEETEEVLAATESEEEIIVVPDESPDENAETEEILY